MPALVSLRKGELLTLVLLPQLCAGVNLVGEERVVYFSFVAPTMCWR